MNESGIENKSAVPPQTLVIDNFESFPFFFYLFVDLFLFGGVVA